MIKIAYLVSSLMRGGPTNQLSYIIHKLDRSKYQPIIITLSPEREGNSQLNEFSEFNVEIYQLNLSRIKGIFTAKKKILDILNKKKVDLVHSQGIRADMISANYLSKYKRVATLRNYPYHDYLMTYGKFTGSIMSYLHIKALKKLESANVCSKSVAEMLQVKINVRFNVVQNGVRVDKYQIADIKEKVSLREKLSLPVDKKIFISVGLLNDRKSPLILIDVMKKFTNAHLIFLGDGDLFEQCNKAIFDIDNIDIVGFVNNVSDYLQASDYFISASKSEGLPNTVMEAMACGLPSVLSDIPPHKEILNFDRRAGRIFELENASDIYDKVNEVLELDYNSSANYARRLVDNNLSSQAMSNKYQSIYSKLINKKRSNL
ncbi:MAG: glycosyltransferase involved in cell wall biosynthesis [Colwellia sp.]